MTTSDQSHPPIRSGDPIDRYRSLLGDSPAVFPIALNLQADSVDFIRLTRDEYSAASFLDARVIGPGTTCVSTPWADVRAATVGLPERCQFIFHISHVGSTLLSRLVGHHPALFSVREPAVLRTLADVQLALDRPGCPWDRREFADRMGVFLSLFSRTFDPDQTAVIKATSFVGELAEFLLDRVTGSRAILMYVTPVTFLRALLGGAMSDVTGSAAKRLYRLHRRLNATPWALPDLSPGECVAMTWLCEMLALCAAAARFPERCLWVDFDGFLAEPRSGLVDVLRHLGIFGTEEFTREVLAGPTMTHYAKAPTQRYDATLRDRLLRQGDADHAEEIRKGLAWLKVTASIPGVRSLFAAGPKPPSRDPRSAGGPHENTIE